MAPQTPNPHEVPLESLHISEVVVTIRYSVVILSGVQFTSAM
jgi:hypothetical protein